MVVIIFFTIKDDFIGDLLQWKLKASFTYYPLSLKSLRVVLQVKWFNAVMISIIVYLDLQNSTV